MWDDLVGRPVGRPCGYLKNPGGRRYNNRRSLYDHCCTGAHVSRFVTSLTSRMSFHNHVLGRMKSFVGTPSLTQTGRRWTYHVVPNSSHVLLIAYVFGPRHVCRPARPRAAPPARSAGVQPTPTRSDHQAAAVQGRRRSTSGDGGGQKRPHNSPFDASPRAAATIWVRPERARGLGLSGWVDRVTRESGTLSRRKG